MRQVIKAERIGVMAREALAEEHPGKVMGVSSSGAFLRVEDNIIFLTGLPYKSPYNLTVPDAARILEKIFPGDGLLVTADQLIFQAQGLIVEIDRAETWVPASPVPCKTLPQQQLMIVLDLIDQVRRQAGDKGYIFLADPVAFPENTAQSNIKAICDDILESFRNEDERRFMASAELLLGSGGGLTPSGDDFLCGFFLYQVRLDQAGRISRKFVQTVLDETIQQARKKTTTISTNRLRAAQRGWSEDVFLTLIDHLFDHRVSLSQNLVEILMNFGHSSGVDTLMGITWGIKAIMR